MNAYVASALLRIAYREHAYAIDRQGMNPGQMPVVDGYPTMRTSVAPSAQAITAKDAEAALIYDDAAFGDLAGGVRRGTTYLGTLRLQLTLDGLRLAGVPGMTLFVEGLNIHGGHPSRFAGDAQGVSNLEGPARWSQ